MTTRATNADALSIGFTAVLEVVGATTLVRLPQEASTALPSRGQVAVQAVLGGHEVGTVLEPDGRRGHWMRVDDDVARAAGAALGDTVEVVVEVARSNAPCGCSASAASTSSSPRMSSRWSASRPNPVSNCAGSVPGRGSLYGRLAGSP